jgi:hypothetical protein
MMRTKARWAPPLHQDVSVVQGGPRLPRRYGAAPEALLRALGAAAAGHGRAAGLAESGRADEPLATRRRDRRCHALCLQHRRRRALWDPEAVRDERRHALVPHLGAPEAVRVLDETGLLTNGRHAAGGARPYRGTAGTVEHGQIGGWLGSAGQLGQAVRLARCLGPRRGPPIAPAAGRRASRTRVAL